ncbi:hypothetical protein [Micromonospora sp. DT47]|uniref:hypothetical protein n=1 Tax=Micromonospora sp. DT47 TaxID=3393431 RepID=UPI003CF25803
MIKNAGHDRPPRWPPRSRAGRAAAGSSSPPLPEPFAAALADADRGLARSELSVPVEDLEKLIGRRPTSLAAAVRAPL